MAIDWGKKHLRVTMPDGSRWDVPVMVIAEDRAAFYAAEFGGSIERSMNEGTLPLFTGRDGTPHEGEIEGWADCMSWSDVKQFASRAPDRMPRDVDFEDGWVNGERELVEK